MRAVTKAGSKKRNAAVDLSTPVLVAEDDERVRVLLCEYLEELGFGDVVVCSSGTRALAEIRARRYGLVISDWHMAPVSGFELLKTIRADPVLRETPFLMMTGDARLGLMNAARDAAANDYLIKPFVLQTLKAKIEAVLQRRPPAVAAKQTRAVEAPKPPSEKEDAWFI